MILHMHSAHIHTYLLVEFQSLVCIHYKVMYVFALLPGSPSYLKDAIFIKKKLLYSNIGFYRGIYYFRILAGAKTEIVLSKIKKIYFSLFFSSKNYRFYFH